MTTKLKNFLQKMKQFVGKSVQNLKSRPTVQAIAGLMYTYRWEIIGVSIFLLLAYFGFPYYSEPVFRFFQLCFSSVFSTEVASAEGSDKDETPKKLLRPHKAIF